MNIGQGIAIAGVWIGWGLLWLGVGVSAHGSDVDADYGGNFVATTGFCSILTIVIYIMGKAVV